MKTNVCSAPCRLWSLALLICILAASPTSAMAAGCPLNSHPDRVEMSGNVKTVHCKCNVGYESRGGQCAKLTAGPRNDSEEVTAYLYRTALEDCQRLTKVRQLLEKKIDQLKAWRGDARRYQREYKALQADAIRGVYSDALDAVPIESIASRVVASYRARARLMSAFDAVRASVSLAEGISEPEDAARFKKIAEGELGTRKALMEIPLAEASSVKTRLWLGNLGKVYGTGVKLSAYALEWRSGEPHELPDRAELVGEVAAVWFPEMRVSVASAKLVVRGAQWYTARNSVADLNGVLAQNWNAESHLRSKIRQISEFVAAENQKIATYRAAHPEARACASGS